MGDTVLVIHKRIPRVGYEHIPRVICKCIPRVVYKRTLLMEYESGFAHDETTDKIIELTLRIRFSLIILAKRFAHELYANLFHIL
ncbi:hypothetical protein CTI18_02620 [Prevotella intermedia]|uniref:Uncharacterized protein n=1 Tax=Prevotella intermedia TaxID=28131 RepID=A0A2G8IA48_PREIN|nr:hypothetical protein CTI18_02620 [Prevotella intermedia]